MLGGYVGDPSAEETRDLLADPAGVATLADLARLLRELRRRQAREQGDAQLTYRELAAKTGWSHGIIGAYLSGQVLPPSDRFDVLVRLLGAAGAELGALATARDRVDERRRGDPAVARPAPAAAPVVPRQLPPAMPYFVGRAAELAKLNALLERSARPGGTVVISAIGGTAGIGKTTLAVHWAHQVADRFADGQLYVNMRGFDATDSPMTPAEAVRGFLDGLGVPPERVPAALDAQVGLYRSLVADRRVLVLLDNARDADQVRPLLPGSPGCVVVVTSRNRLSSLVAAEGAEPLTLDLLSAAEARQLLARRLGEGRIATDPGSVSEVIAGCARLPLALAILAARAAVHPDFPLSTLAAELRKARSSLDGFEDGETATSVRTVFSLSYRQLSEPAARLFRLLGLHPGPHVGTAAAASLAGQPAEQARAALAELNRANMVAEPAPSRYTFHDLLRAYAAELVHSLDPELDRHAATRRMVDHYLHSAHAADRLVHPDRDPIALVPAQPGVTVQPVADRGRALAWFAVEHPVLLAVVRQAVGAGFDTETCQLVWAFADFLDWRGHWRDLAETQRAALAAAKRLGDRPEQARANRSLGSAYTRLGRYDDARTHLRNALDLYRALRDPVGGAHTHLHFSETFEREGRHGEALQHARQTLALARAAKHPKWCARGLNAVGWYHAQLGEHRQALTHCRQALALQEEMGDRDGAADTWDSLGYAHHHLGEYPQAVDCYRRAVELWQETGNRRGQADTLVNLGDTLAAMDQADTAREAWRQALVILDDLGLPDAERVRANLHRLTTEV
jgi:tetratricopeptide (TPR) repeat protein